MLRITVILSLLFLTATNTLAQKVTVGNNLLYDATLTPNLRIGVRLSPHWSVGLTGGYRPWPTDDQASRKWKHLLVSPDLRYWSDSVNVHHFFGINPVYAHYNISGVQLPFNLYQLDKDKRYQGDFGGLGVFYGYSWPLGRHWNIEALVGGIVGYAKYDIYECGHCGKKVGDDKKLLVLPQAALNIVYNIPARPRKVVEEVVEPVLQPQEPVRTTAKIEQKVFKPIVSPVPDNTGRAGELQRNNPVLAHISTYKPYDRTRILRKEKDALYVHFALGKSVLDNSFRENRLTLDRITDITRQIMADSTSSVQKIQIIGLASIEGAIAGNEQLAQNRAMALQRYIQDQLDISDTMFEAVGGGEAWADFRDQLNDEVIAGNGKLQAAIDVIDSESDLNVRERKLRQLDKGRTWQYIKQNILKDQRNSGYIRIYYDYVPDKAAATINEASQLLAAGRYQDALSKLNTVRHDERAQNALGVALWQTGQKEEALRCFRRAADNGNADAKENLRQLGNQ
jgi:outer membrane protein OmpA-like peptidoglycan-associated protein